MKTPLEHNTKRIGKWGCGKGVAEGLTRIKGGKISSEGGRFSENTLQVVIPGSPSSVRRQKIITLFSVPWPGACYESEWWVHQTLTVYFFFFGLPCKFYLYRDRSLDINFHSVDGVKRTGVDPSNELSLDLSRMIISLSFV